MRNVSINIVDGFHFRYLIQTRIIDEILASKEIRIHIFSAENIFDSIKEHFKNEKDLIAINKLEKYRANINGKILFFLRSSSSGVDYGNNQQ